jgi:hypothetical protein
MDEGTKPAIRSVCSYDGAEPAICREQEPFYEHQLEKIVTAPAMNCRNHDPSEIHNISPGRDVRFPATVKFKPGVWSRGEPSTRRQETVNADDDISATIIELVPCVARGVFLRETLTAEAIHFRVECRRVEQFENWHGSHLMRAERGEKPKTVRHHC